MFKAVVISSAVLFYQIPERCPTQKSGEHPWQMEKVLQRSFEPRHSQTVRHTWGAFVGGKCR